MLNALWLNSVLLATLAPQTVTGTVSYRERIALPKDAVLTVAVDHFDKDGQRNLSELTMPLGNQQVPVPFTMSWLSVSGGRTGVRAQITVDGKVMFHSDRHTMVGSSVKKLSLVLSKAEVYPQPGLTGQTWELASLGAEAVTLEGRKPTLEFASGKIRGYSGVNQFGGDYESSPGLIQIDPGAMTLMAGEPARMELETQFLAVLPRANRWAIFEGELVLMRGEKELARFRKLRSH